MDSGFFVLFIELLLITVIIGILNWYSTPTMMEDLLYRFVWQQDWNGPFKPISSLEDVFRSQVIHYWSNCGRSVMHTVVQVLLGLVPEGLGKMLNTGMFLLMMVLVTKICNTPKELRTVTVAVSFTMLFVLMQGFNMGFIWIVGANNYLWPMVLNMAFILMLRAINKGQLGWHHLLWMFPFSLIAGWTHEALAVPMVIAQLYWLLGHRRSGISACCILAYMLGLTMIMLSPTLWNRVNVEGVTLQQRLMACVINLVLNVRTSWLLLATLAILLYRGKEVFTSRLKANRYILTAWFTALGIVLVCGESLERVAIYADFLAMLSLLSIWQGEWLYRHMRVIASVTMIICVIVGIPVIALNRENHENYLYHCNQLEKQDSHIIKIRQIADGTNLVDQWLRKRYVYPNVMFGFPNCYMPFDSQDLETRCVAKLFNKDSIVMMPEDVVNKIETDTAAYTHWEADSNEKLYIWRMQPSQQVCRVVFELGDEVSLPFYKRWTTYQGDEFELDDFKYKVISLKGNDYLVMTIPPNRIKRRIRAIKIQTIC